MNYHDLKAVVKKSTPINGFLPIQPISVIIKLAHQ